jgi:sec-independent protein translocase protein TatB
MFDLGFAELLVIGIVALIVVGPKDLPVMFRNVGRFVGRMRGMAREFTTAMNQAADESGLKDIQKTLNTAANPMKAAVNEAKDAAKGLADFDFDPESETGKLASKKMEERLETSRKIEAATARAQAERKAKEAQEALARAEALELELRPEVLNGDTPKET